MTYSILVLNKFPEVFTRFYASLLESEGANHNRLLVVCDNHDGANLGPGSFETIASYGAFVFSKNVNIGFNALGSDDVILCNDDIAFPVKHSLKLIAGYAELHPNAGIIAPLVDGGVGNPYQDYNRTGELWKPGKVDGTVTGRRAESLPVCFICVYIKRALINEIGPMDESFIHYGYDDNDYCLRARRANWKTKITGNVHIKHGIGGKDNELGINWHLTYNKTPGLESNLRIFLNKWQPELRKD